MAPACTPPVSLFFSCGSRSLEVLVVVNGDTVFRVRKGLPCGGGSAERQAETDCSARVEVKDVVSQCNV